MGLESASLYLMTGAGYSAVQFCTVGAHSVQWCTVQYRPVGPALWAYRPVGYSAVQRSAAAYSAAQKWCSAHHLTHAEHDWGAPDVHQQLLQLQHSYVNCVKLAAAGCTTAFASTSQYSCLTQRH
jgi:hypothetical protein